MTQTDNGSGYLSVGLTFEGKTKNLRVSRIVAISWIENKENKPQVNHINGIKYDNRVENLEWNTSGENVMHAWNNGLAQKRHSYQKLNKKMNLILPYVTEGVTVITPKGVGRVVIGQSNFRIEYKDGTRENLVKSIRFWGDDFKLALRELSDLTKEIEHNGGKFIPIELIGKLFIEKGGFNEGFFGWGLPTGGDDYQDYYLTIEQKEENLWMNTWCGRPDENGYEIESHVLEYTAFFQLIKWHFDVFGLLDQNLAINLNEVK